jgi:hypothetical protein
MFAVTGITGQVGGATGGGGHVFRYNCQPIVEAGQALLVE